MKPRRLSLRGAIDRHCKNCLYDPGSRGLGSWREQIDGCTSTNCALWPVRPRSTSERIWAGCLGVTHDSAPDLMRRLDRKLDIRRGLSL